MNKKKSIHKLLIFAVLLLCALTIFVLQKMVNYHYNSSAEYELNKNSNAVISKIISLQNSNNTAQSYFLIFQTDKGKIVDSVFYKENNLFGTSYQIYVESEYDDKDLDNEINRIKNLSCKKNGITQNVIYSKSGFLYEAYITIFEENIHEYALVDKDTNRVYYVYEQFSDVENGNIPKDMLWMDFNPNKINTDKGYNMYLFFDGQGWDK